MPSHFSLRLGSGRSPAAWTDFLGEPMKPDPIFVCGFSRGGTTILMNLIASHPEVCTVGETHQLFKGSNILDSPLQIASKALFRDLPVILSTGQDFLSPRNIAQRPRLGAGTRELIRRVFERSKADSGHAHLNRYKSPTEVYQQTEIDSARMLAKNLDGAVLLTDMLREIYPNCYFVGMTRNGLAVCEGHTRRGRRAEDVGDLYARIAGKMLADANSLERYQLLRYEDLMADPVQQLRKILRGLDLDPLAVDQVRLQERKVITASGHHRLRNEATTEWDVHWLPLEALPERLDAQVNDRQIARLNEADRLAFAKRTRGVMAVLDYPCGPVVRRTSTVFPRAA